MVARSSFSKNAVESFNRLACSTIEPTCGFILPVTGKRLSSKKQSDKKALGTIQHPGGKTVVLHQAKPVEGVSTRLVE
jgi:hypothetical protein